VVCKRVAQLLGVADIGAPEETFWAIRRMLEAIARRHALVLIFDDVHWGESTFLDLVEHVAAWARDAPILLLCMGRPELLDRRPTWGGGKLNATTVSLEPLTETEAEELIANLIGAAELSHDLRGKIAIGAEGNPLFVEEMLAMLIDDGELTREDGRWVSTTDLSNVSVPPTITALLAARLDQLSVGERSLIERASVVGKEFFRGAVRALTPETERPTVDDNLMALVRKELVRPDRSTLPGEDAFRFRHLLVRDAAYDATPKEVRANLHEEFATWLERVAGDRISEQEEILGYHLERAYHLRSELGPADKRVLALATSSASRLEAAAKRALGRGDTSAALTLAERAYGLMPADDPRRSHATRTLLMALDESAAIERKVNVAEEALEFALRTGDRALEWWIRAEQAFDLMLHRPRETTLDKLRETAASSVRVAEEFEDPEDINRALTGLASVEWTVGDMEDMLATSERALEFALRSPTGDLGVPVNYIAVGMFLGRSPASAALARMRELVDVCSDQRVAEVTARMLVGMFLGLLGRSQAGRRDVVDGLHVFDDLANPWTRWFGQADAGRFRHVIGEYAVAEIHLRAASEGWRELGVPSNAVLSAPTWADSLCWLGRPEEAIVVIEEFGQLAGPWDLQPRIEFGTVRARALGGLGRLDEAVSVISEIESLVRTTGFITLLAEAVFAKAEVFGLAGRRDDAIVAAREALEIFERKEFIPYQERTRALLSAQE